MNFEYLNSRNIFPVDISEYQKDVFLLYSPLKKQCLFADKETVRKMENQDCHYSEIIKRLTGHSNEIFSSFCNQTPDAVVRMSIIPTHRCNFKCSYCYAAKGRDNCTLSPKVMLAAINHFVNPARTARRDLYISIVGGGEPLMAWLEVTRDTIIELRKREKEHGFRIRIMLTSNGSLITDEIAEFLKINNVNVSVSFDILPDIQESERGYATDVEEGIRCLIRNDCKTSFRTTITPLNVNRQVEMVEYAHRFFPQIRKINFEYVISNELFATVDSLSKFFKNFTSDFFHAREVAKEYGISLITPTLKNIESVSDRFCSGDFCLTPSGAITGCHRFSSPNEEHYTDCLYGHVCPDGTVRIDGQSFGKLMSHNVYSHDECRTCFAKWHCGGQCLGRLYSYNNEKRQAVCDFIRDFTLQTLLRKMPPPNKSIEVDAAQDKA